VMKTCATCGSDKHIPKPHGEILCVNGHLGMPRLGSSETRRIDDLGRLVIPKAWRVYLGIHEGDELRLELRDGGVWITREDDAE
jgi:AbrB family looped-hinge helix DNA binding protein